MRGGDFFSRWSQRKRDAAEADAEPEGMEAHAEDAEDELAAPEPAVTEPDAPDPELLASLPPLDQIGSATDIRGFLQKGVPRALRNAALRKAWASDPLIANYADPARDYFWDYNTPGAAPGYSGRLSEAMRETAGRYLTAREQPAEAEGETAASDPVMPRPAPAAPEDAPPEPVSAPPSAKLADAARPEIPPAEAATPDPGVQPRRHGSATPV
ncbi:MAG: DUF3306 domain-containing protein [Paracoccus sp. (in: a-proteobacteria)]|nr:DUF3306 domain-containing protein [Paracoccus sp. (in: a-proteobacteria)]